MNKLLIEPWRCYGLLYIDVGLRRYVVRPRDLGECFYRLETEFNLNLC